MSAYVYAVHAARFKLVGLPHRRLEQWLRIFYQKHTQLVRSALLGGTLMGLGFGLLYIGVSRLHEGKILTNLVLAPPMNTLGWYLNRRFIWADRHTQAEEDLSRWAVKWVVSGVISQGGYVLLVSTGLPYGVARWLLNCTLGPLSYVANKFWIFTHRGFRLAWAIRAAWLILIVAGVAAQTKTKTVTA